MNDAAVAPEATVAQICDAFYVKRNRGWRKVTDIRFSREEFYKGPCGGPSGV